MMILEQRARTGIALYPIFAAVMPVLLFYNTQAALEMPPDEIVNPLLIMTSAGVLVYLLCSTITRSARLGALLATSFWTIFYSLTYCVILDGLFKVCGASVSATAAAPFWLPVFWLLTLVPVVLYVLKSHAIPQVESLLEGTFLLLFLLQVAVFATNLFNYSSICNSVERLQLKQIELLNAKKSDFKPDVFYIILDQMAGRDGLKDYLQYDDDWFYASLEKRGFYTAKKSLSNYPITRLSLASSLNMSLLDKYKSAAGPDNKNWTMMNKLARDNNIARIFKKQGYKYVLVDSGFAASNRSNLADEILSSSFTDFFSERILRSSVLELFAGTEESVMSLSRNRILNQFRFLEDMRQDSRPKFVFAHFLCPHEPYLFGAKGEPVFYPGDRCDREWTAETKRAYLAQVEFIQKKTLSTIDRILAQNPNAIIVLQGDHGTHCSDYVSKHSPSDKLLNERYSILNAYKVPASIQSKLADDIEPVNSFAVILNGLFNCDVANSPTKQIYSSYDEPFLFQEVSKRIIRRPRP